MEIKPCPFCGDINCCISCEEYTGGHSGTEWTYCVVCTCGAQGPDWRVKDTKKWDEQGISLEERQKKAKEWAVIDWNNRST